MGCPTKIKQLLTKKNSTVLVDDGNSAQRDVFVNIHSSILSLDFLQRINIFIFHNVFFIFSKVLIILESKKTRLKAKRNKKAYFDVKILQQFKVYWRSKYNCIFKPKQAMSCF